MSSRREIADLLSRWQSGAIGPSEVKTWVDSARAPDGDRAAIEVLAALDLLEIQLLTKEDVPALLTLLESDGSSPRIAAWSRYRDAIDLDARSKQLKKDKFYKPFCR